MGYDHYTVAVEITFVTFFQHSQRYARGRSWPLVAARAILSNFFEDQ